MNAFIYMLKVFFFIFVFSSRSVVCWMRSLPDLPLTDKWIGIVCQHIYNVWMESVINVNCIIASGVCILDRRYILLSYLRICNACALILQQTLSYFIVITWILCVCVCVCAWWFWFDADCNSTGLINNRNMMNKLLPKSSKT